MGYQDDYLAFCASDPETGELTGALRDYLDAAADCLGNAHLDFEPVAYPGTDAAPEALKNGEVDCIFPSNLSAYEGEELGVFMTPPILSAECYVLVRKDEQSTFTAQEELTFAAEAYDINYRTLVMDQFDRWQIREYPDTLPCLLAVASGEADCYLTSNYQYNDLRRDCEKLGLTLLATGKEADFSIAVSGDNRELYSILTRTTTFISDTSMNAALTYYTAEGAKLSLMELILDNLPFVIGAVIVLILLILLVIVQRRVIEQQRKVNEQQKQLVATKELAFKDPLTGVKSKHAYVQVERRLDEEIENGTVPAFSVGCLT